MPTILQGEPGTQMDTPAMRDVMRDAQYEYPDGLPLKPDSKLHKDLVRELLSRARTSYSHMSKRHTSWRATDKTLTAYIPTTDEEDRIKREDVRKPVSIVYPYTHAILESLLGYMVAAFFQEPIFRYEGHGPDDILGSILLTKAVQLQCARNKVALSLHTMFRDSFAYGIGITVPSWKIQTGKRLVNEDVGFVSSITNRFKKNGTKQILQDVTISEGNSLINIDPYKALLDPNVPAHEVQSGEFFGWIEHTNVMALLSEEQESPEHIFNVKFVKATKNRKTAIMDKDNSDRGIRFRGNPEDSTNDTNPVDVLHMYVNLIPKDWDLGDSEYPEKWYFKLAGDSIIIQARPTELNHGMFPVSIIAPDFDGYSSTPIARLEMLSGMQGTLDWLFNVHIANVRKAVNDIFVYDPYQINSKDLENPQNGWLIRTRKPAWGKGVKDSIQQLQVNDVTRQNVGDSSWVVQLMDKIGAVDGAMQGSLRQGGPERLSSAEYQGTQQAGFSRLERMAKIIGLQGMQDIGYQFAAHTQQFASEEFYIKVLGDHEAQLTQEYGKKIKKGRMLIDPSELQVGYDILVRDGSIPGGNYSQVWEKMFQVIASTPGLAEQFDLTRIFMHIARNNGAKNVTDFIKVQSAPDEQVLEQARKGNLVPVGEEV